MPDKKDYAALMNAAEANSKQAPAGKDYASMMNQAQSSAAVDQSQPANNSNAITTTSAAPTPTQASTSSEDNPVPAKDATPIPHSLQVQAGTPPEQVRQAMVEANNAYVRLMRNMGGGEAVTPGSDQSPKAVAPTVMESLTQAGLDAMRSSIKREVDAGRDYIIKDFQQNSDRMQGHWVASGEKNNLPTQVGRSLQLPDGQGVPSVANANAINDQYQNRLADPTRDPRALKEYVDARRAMFQKDRAEEIAMAFAKAGEGGSGDASAISAKYDKMEADFSNAVAGLAYQKVVNSFLKDGKTLDAKRVGMEVQRTLGNAEEIDRQERLSRKGIAAPAAASVNHEVIGYRAIQYAARAASGEGQDAVAKKLDDASSNYMDRIRANNPKFVKEQRVLAIQQGIAKENSNPLRNALIGYSPSQEDIEDYARRNNINAEGITPEDVGTIAPLANRIVGSFIQNSAGALYTSGMRAFAGTADAVSPGFVDWDRFNEHYNDDWYDNTFLGGLTTGKLTKSSGQLFQGGQKVSTDADQNYLMTVKNDEAGAFTYSVDAIANQMADGLGQILAFGYGSGQLSKGVQTMEVLGKAAEGTAAAERIAANADRIGTALNVGLTQYNNSYNEALQAIGDGPEQENSRNAYALLRMVSSAATEMILPDQKIVSDIFGAGTAAGRQIIDQVTRNGISSLERKTVSGMYVAAVKAGVKDWAKETSEDVLDQTGTWVADALLAPQKLDSTDFAQDLKQTVVTSALSSLIPTFSGGARRRMQQPAIDAHLMYQVGANPDNYIAEIKSQVDDGTLTTEQGNDKIKTINTMTAIVNNGVPSENRDGQPLTQAQKVAYANSLLQSTILEAKQKGVEDDVMREDIVNQLDQRRMERLAIVTQQILQPQPQAATPTPAPVQTPPPASGPTGDALQTPSVRPQEVAAAPLEPTPFVDEEPTVGALIQSGRPVTIDGQRATLSLDGQRVIASIGNSNREYEVGNIDQLRDTQVNAVDGFDMQAERPEVSITNQGKYYIRGSFYANNFSDPTAAINYDDSGNVVSVNLDTDNGAKRTFRGQTAEDIAYQIHLQQLASRNEQREFQDFLERDDEATQQLDRYAGSLQQAPDSGEAKTPAQVPAAESAAIRQPDVARPVSDPNNPLQQSTANDTTTPATPSPVQSQSPAAPAGSQYQQATPQPAAGNTAQVQPSPGMDAGVQAPAAGGISMPNGAQQIQGAQVDNRYGFVEDQPEVTPPDPIVAQGAEASVSSQAVSGGSQTQAQPRQVGQNIRDRFANAPTQEGVSYTRTLSDGTQLPGRYILTTAEAATPSHDPATFGTSQGFPTLADGRNPNDRDYSLPENRERVIARSSSYDGRAVEDVPTVDANGVVIDGNDRVMSGQIAARQGTDAAYVAQLRANAPAYGFTAQQVDDMIAAGQSPRLLFQADEVQPYTTETFARFNPTESGKAKSAQEQAITLSRTLPANAARIISDAVAPFATMSDFYNLPSATRQVRDALVQAGVLTNDSLPRYYNNQRGAFTEDGKQLLQNVMLGQVFDEDAIGILASNPGLQQKMMLAMKNLLAIEQRPEFSLKPLITAALRLKSRIDAYAAESGIANKDQAAMQYMQAGDLFASMPTKEELGVYMEMESPATKSMVKFTGDYLNQIQNYQPGETQDLFGEKQPTRAALIDQLSAKARQFEPYVNQPAAEQPIINAVNAELQQPNISQDLADVQQDGQLGPADATQEGQPQGGSVDPVTAIAAAEEAAEAQPVDPAAPDVEMILPSIEISTAVSDGGNQPAVIPSEASKPVTTVASNGKPEPTGDKRQDAINEFAWRQGVLEKKQLRLERIPQQIAEEQNDLRLAQLAMQSAEPGDKVYEANKRVVESATANIKKMQADITNARATLPEAQRNAEAARVKMEKLVGRSAPVAATEDAQPAEQPPAPTEAPQQTPYEVAQAEANVAHANIERLKNHLDTLKGEAKTQAWQDEVARVKDELAAYRKQERAAKARMTRAKGKGMADAIRRGKGDENIITANVFGVSTKLGNEAIEVVAKAVEGGAAIAAAIQQGVDYVNNRWFTSWSEQKLRDLMGENQLVALTPAEMRAHVESGIGLSPKNEQAARAMVDDIKTDKMSLADAMAYINSLPIGAGTKANIKQYVNQYADREVFMADGGAIAANMLAQNGNDFDLAINSLLNAQAQATAAAQTPAAKANQQARYTFALTTLQSQKTAAAVSSGAIQPTIQRGPQAAPAGSFQLPERGLVDKIRDAVQNKNRRAEQAVENSVVPVTQDNDFATAVQTSKSKAATAINKIQERVGYLNPKAGTMFYRMAKDKIDFGKFSAYLYALHAKERNDQNAKDRQSAFDAQLYNLNKEMANKQGTQRAVAIQSEIADLMAQKNPKFPLMPDGGSGMTNQQADQVIAEATADGMIAKYDQYAQEFRKEVVDRILDVKHEAGIIDDETYNKLKTHYKFYVPLKIDDDQANDVTGKPYYSSSSAINGKDIYRSRGAVDKDMAARVNVVSQAVIDLENAFKQAEDNKAMFIMGNFIKQNPNDQIWGVVPAAYTQLRDANGNVVSSEPMAKPSNTVSSYYEGGKLRYIVSEDDGIKNMFKTVSHPEIVHKLSQVSRYFTLMYAQMSPSFVVRNVFSDQQDAYMSGLANQDPTFSKHFRSYLGKNQVQILAALRGKQNKWTAIIEDFKKNGGEISFLTHLSNENAAEKAMKLYNSQLSANPLSLANRRKFGEALKEFAGSLEQLTRIQAYRAAVEAGIDTLMGKGMTRAQAEQAVNRGKAATVSRNATIDFEKKGYMSPYLSIVKAFINPGVQGVANTFWLIKNHRKAQIFVASMMGLGFLNAELSRAFGDCDSPTASEDCWDEIPDYVKSRNLMLPSFLVGGENSGYTGIPMGRAFTFFQYLGGSVSSAIHGKLKAGEFTGNVMSVLFQNYNPVGGDAPLEQQFVGNLAPVVALLTNKSSIGDMGIRPGNESKLASQDFYPKTSDAYITLADQLHKVSGGGPGKAGAVEMSPNQMDYMMQTAFGGVYNFAKQSATLYNHASDDAEGNVQEKDFPIWNIFRRESNMAGTQNTYFSLAEKSKAEVLSGEEQSILKAALERLEAGGIITSEQKGKRFNFVERNQTTLQRKLEESGNDSTPQATASVAVDQAPSTEGGAPAEGSANTEGSTSTEGSIAE